MSSPSKHFISIRSFETDVKTTATTEQYLFILPLLNPSHFNSFQASYNLKKKYLTTPSKVIQRLEELDCRPRLLSIFGN
jgi:hypothetical protein